MINGIREICQLGGFTVTKWISNSREVLKSIPDADRATSVADLNFDNFPSERALGVSWNIDDDTLGFLIKLKQCSPTRRNILSIISTIFDPLGIVSPYILPARIILQDLCCRQIGWDDGLSDTDILDVSSLNLWSLTRSLLLNSRSKGEHHDTKGSAKHP